MPSMGFSSASDGGLSGGNMAQNPFDVDGSPQQLSDSVFHDTDVIADTQQVGLVLGDTKTEWYMRVRESPDCVDFIIRFS